MAELAATSTVVLGSVAFAIFWVLSVFPAFPLLPIGRTAGSLLTAVLMVNFGAMTPEDAYAAIDIPIVAFLFATMVVSAYLERAGLFAHLRRLLVWKSQGPKDLLFRICLVSAVTSALFTNDTCCVVLTPFVLDLARQHDLPAEPFLLALASSANIGSAATPIGNPQNLIIAAQSKISFGKFSLSLLPAMLVGIFFNAIILILLYRKQLCEANDVERAMPLLSSTDSEEENGEPESLIRKPKRHWWRASVYLVTVGMLAALLMGMNMPWTALTAALVLVVLDLKDAQPCLEKVSHSLLIFFCGMFITVEGFKQTGLPSAVWNSMEAYARIDRPSGIVVLCAVVLLLSNTVSNVPTVLLLGAQVAASAARISAAQETKAWLVLAWVSTVAGNLTLLGSAANLIVCEQAKRVRSQGYNLSFSAHLRFGLLSTLVVMAVGLLLIRN